MLNHIVEVVIIVLALIVAVALTLHRWQERDIARRDRRRAQREYLEAQERLDADDYLATIRAKSITDALVDFNAAFNGKPLSRQPSFQDAIDRFS